MQSDSSNEIQREVRQRRQEKNACMCVIRKYKTKWKY